MDNWYDEGEGSEKMKRDIAQSAKNNPVSPAICCVCEVIDDNERLREALDGSSRIVEKYRDSCMEWAKESHHKGNRQNKEFWERRAKSMANLLIMNANALAPKEESPND